MVWIRRASAGNFAETKIEELSTTIATAEKDLASATKIREKENADFEKVQAELMEGVSMLERAIAIIEREMAKTGFIQGADSMKKVGPERGRIRPHDFACCLTDCC